MKKILLLLALTLSILACSKESDDTPTEQEIWLNGYTAFLPTSKYELASVEFLFFSANNNEVYQTESKTFDGTISEYQSLKDEAFELLQDEQMKLTSGEVIKAIKSVYVPNFKPRDTYKSAKLPIGKYYVVAIYQGGRDGYQCLYSTKYAGMYYELKHSYNPPALSVVFPCDRTRYGFTPWVSWGERFLYDFTF